MSIALSLGNNLTTNGVFKASAVNNTSCDNVTSFSGITGGGGLQLLSTQTASGSSSITFTTGIDSTYNRYVFSFLELHPSVDNVLLEINGSTDAGSNYNAIKTTTYFKSYNNVATANYALQYGTASDVAQSTGNFTAIENVGSANYQSVSGYFDLCIPSDTTYVKNFYCHSTATGSGPFEITSYVAGYFNTTSAVDGIRFSFSSGNIDTGTIKMYGVTKS